MALTRENFPDIPETDHRLMDAAAVREAYKSQLQELATLRADLVAMEKHDAQMVEERDRWWKIGEDGLVEINTLLAKLAEAQAEVQHYRDAASSVGESDGHGWAETTKELKLELATLRASQAAMEAAIKDARGLCDMLLQPELAGCQFGSLHVEAQRLLDALARRTP